MPLKKRTRSLSPADKDPKIAEIVKLRDTIADKEKAGEACKGMYRAFKEGKMAVLDGIHAKLMKLKEKEKTGGRARSRSRSRKRGRSRTRK